MRNGIIITAIAFAVALAYFVGSRLSNEALAVVVGAVCGISASIPVCIALVIASSNNWGRREESIEPDNFRYGYDARRYGYGELRHRQSQPPIVFVSPPQTQMPYAPYGVPQNPYLAVANYAAVIPASAKDVALGTREFKIIGGE